MAWLFARCFSTMASGISEKYVACLYCICIYAYTPITIYLVFHRVSQLLSPKPSDLRGEMQPRMMINWQPFLYSASNAGAALTSPPPFSLFSPALDRSTLPSTMAHPYLPACSNQGGSPCRPMSAPALS